ncbi:MAG: hypothetical protein IJ183_04950 [Prevotella sp.]|nr:hypothetical protein [Prevotella sp.]
MKKFFTLIVVLVAAMSAMAQNHGAMAFVGTSTYYVVGMESSTMTNTENDKVVLTLTGDGSKQASIVIPDMEYDLSGNLMSLRSFTANSGVEYVMTGSYMTGDMAFEWAEGDFSTTTIGADGNVKNVAGKISAKYAHNAKKFEMSAEFTYGAMPFPIHYEIVGDYVKESAVEGIAENATVYVNAPVTNLAGQRVGRDAKGLLIVNGKKVIR